MYSKMRTAILCCVALAVLATASLAADTTSARPRRSTSRTQPTGEAAGGAAAAAGTPTTGQPAVPLPAELSIGLEEMLKMVNEGKKPSKDDVDAVESLVQQNKKNLLKFDAPDKVKYLMLSAWNSYFAGNMDMAVQAAVAGLAAGPDDPDMKATYAAMAVSAGKYPLLGKLAVKAPTTRRRSRGATTEEPQTTSTSTASGVLNFDLAALRPQAAGRKVTGMDATYNCIGGATFAAGKSDLLYVLAWRSVAVQKAARPAAAGAVSSEEAAPTSPSESDPASAFGTLMVDYTGSDKVSFIGVNLDDAAAKYNAMKEVGAKGWFWPQIMAMEPANKAFAELAKYDVTRPTLAIMTKDGTIAYMGSPAGFLPKLVVAKATDNYVPELFVPAKPAGMIDPNARRAMRASDPNMRGRRTIDPNAVKGKAATGGVDDALQMGSDLKAEELYNNAKSFLKGSRTTAFTAGPGVQYCRQILEQYPNTQYAAKARELLRELPDDLKTRYNITPAEMGQ